MEILEQAQALNKIFKGLEDAYGCYRIDNMKVKAVKKTGMAKTETSRPLTVDQWKEHLEGKIGLGVVPINRRNKCNWACIDIDSYEGFDHKKLLQNIFDMGLPILVCKSKSGGAHCFLFLSEEVECTYVRQYLTKISICIGHPGVEVFPKQDKLISEQDKGNWLNMPYFNTDQRRCIVLADDGIRELTLEEFAERVELEALTEDQFFEIFNDYNPDKADAVNIKDEIVQQAPPCIISISKAGIQNGSRSDVLIHYGTFIYKKYGPDQFNVYMPEINQKYCVEPLSAQELNSTVLLSLNKDRDYKYRCNHPAIKPYCNPNLCIQCPYGIPSKEFIPKFSDLVMIKSDPAIYFMNTNYGKLMILGDDLNKPKEIQAACLAQLHIRPPLLKDNAWSEVLNELLPKMKIEEPPKDTQKIELIKNGIKEFIQANVSDDKKTIKETNGVYYSAEQEKSYFRLQDVYAHLLKYNIIDRRKDTKADLSIIMDELGIEKRRMRITMNGKKLDLHLRGMQMKEVNLDIEVEDFDLDEGEEIK